MSSTIGVRRVRVPFRVPFETAAGTWVARDSLLVELRDDSGARGIGEAPIDGALSTVTLTAHVQRVLDGDDAGVPEALRHAVASGVGGALLDLAPPPEPVATAVRAGVAVNATIAALDIDETVAASVAAVADGYLTLKLKAGSRESSTGLAERLRAVRSAIGQGIALRLDVNGTWDADGALERLRALEAVELQYVEQPLAVGARGATARLRTMTRVPIAADEAVTSPDIALDLVRAEAVDVLVVKPARVGGPAAVAAIAISAAAHGVPVVVSSMFETGVGLAAAIACASILPDVPGWPAADRAHGLATGGVLKHDLLVVPLVLAGGWIRAPFRGAGGGLGITLDEAAVERYAVDA